MNKLRGKEKSKIYKEKSKKEKKKYKIHVWIETASRK